MSGIAMESQKERLADLRADPRVRLAGWGTAIVVVLGLIGWFMQGPASEQARQLPPDPFTTPEAAAARIRTLAQQYGTDFDRLSAEDKMILNKIAAGHGRELLAKTARDLKTEKAP